MSLAALARVGSRLPGRLVGAWVALALALTACAPPAAPPAAPASGGPPSPAAAQPAAPATASPAPAAAAPPPASANPPAPAANPPAAAPRTLDKPVVIVQGTDPPTLDPQFHESGVLGNINAAIFDQLLQYDRDMKIVGELATEWKMGEGGRTWTFTLRRDATFWNGEPLNAEAVAFTFNRMLDPELRKQGLNDPFPARTGLESVRATGDYTVEFTLKQPTIMFEVFVTFVPILEPKHYGTRSVRKTATGPMGSGPWRFVSWVKDGELRLSANPSYWRGKPQIETLIFKAVPDATSRLSLLQTGEADIVVDLTPEDVSVLAGDPNVRVSKAVGGRRIHIGIPTDKYRDKRVRQAFNYAVDFDTINRTLLGGLAFGRMVTPVNGDYWIDPAIKPYPYDPEKAKALLREANFPLDTKMTIYTPSGRYVKDKEIAQVVAADFRRIGLTNVEVQVLDFAVFSERVNKRQMDDLSLLGLGSRFFAPEDAMIFSKDSLFDVTNWSVNTEGGRRYEELREQLQTTFEPEKQRELMYQIEALFQDEAPWIYLWNQVALFGVSKRIDWEASGNSRIELWLPGEKDTRIIQ